MVWISIPSGRVNVSAGISISSARAVATCTISPQSVVMELFKVIPLYTHTVCFTTLPIMNTATVYIVHSLSSKVSLPISLILFLLMFLGD